MMRCWPATRRRWNCGSKTRSWDYTQRKTLARLGVVFDKVIFESDFLPEVAEYTNLGLGAATSIWSPRRR